MRALLASLVLALLVVVPVSAGATPSGSFTLSGAFTEGATITADVTTSRVNGKTEVTLGIWCFQPDGTQMAIGNHGNPYIYELTSIRGAWAGPQTFTLWTTGTGYSCTARLVAVEWFKDTPVAGWVLDEQQFAVEA